MLNINYITNNISKQAGCKPISAIYLLKSQYTPKSIGT